MPSTPSTYSVVVTDPHTQPLAGPARVLRECGHEHLTSAAAERCLKKLRKDIDPEDPESLENPWFHARVVENNSDIDEVEEEEEADPAWKVSQENMDDLIHLIFHFPDSPTPQRLLSSIANRVQMLAHMAYLQGKMDAEFEMMHECFDDENEDDEGTPMPGPQGVN